MYLTYCQCFVQYQSPLTLTINQIDFDTILQFYNKKSQPNQNLEKWNRTTQPRFLVILGTLCSPKSYLYYKKKLGYTFTFRNLKKKKPNKQKKEKMMMKNNNHDNIYVMASFMHAFCFPHGDSNYTPRNEVVWV
jgi:hypothetical protein